MIRNTIIALVIACASFAVFAETTKLSAIEQFHNQKATILQDLKDDTVYREISYHDAKIVRDALDRMTALLEGHGDVAEMSPDDQVRLFNEQDLVNTVLTMAENDSRTVCRRRGQLGTNFKTTTCETIKERRERQEADRRAIDWFLKGTPIDSN